MKHYIEKIKPLWAFRTFQQEIHMPEKKNDMTNHYETFQ